MFVLLTNNLSKSIKTFLVLFDLIWFCFFFFFFLTSYCFIICTQNHKITCKNKNHPGWKSKQKKYRMITTISKILELKEPLLLLVNQFLASQRHLCCHSHVVTKRNLFPLEKEKNLLTIYPEIGSPCFVEWVLEKIVTVVFFVVINSVVKNHWLEIIKIIKSNISYLCCTKFFNFT